MKPRWPGEQAGWFRPRAHRLWARSIDDPRDRSPQYPRSWRSEPGYCKTVCRPQWSTSGQGTRSPSAENITTQTRQIDLHKKTAWATAAWHENAKPVCTQCTCEDGEAFPFTLTPTALPILLRLCFIYRFPRGCFFIFQLNAKKTKTMIMYCVSTTQSYICSITLYNDVFSINLVRIMNHKKLVRRCRTRRQRK